MSKDVNLWAVQNLLAACKQLLSLSTVQPHPNLTSTAFSAGLARAQDMIRPAYIEATTTIVRDIVREKEPAKIGGEHAPDACQKSCKCAVEQN